MEKEIIALASRNSGLEKEKDDLSMLIEQRDYEVLQLKSHLEFILAGGVTNGSNNINTGEPQNIANNLNIFDNFHANNVEYSIMNDNGGNDYVYDVHDDMDNVDNNNDHNNNNDDDDNNNNNINEKPFSPTKYKPLADLKDNNKPITTTKNVPDVVKEYLHLTASAVKIKFPQIDTISSEQLIQQVQDFPFSDYYDHMMRIMKNEQAKLTLEEDKKKINHLNNTLLCIAILNNHGDNFLPILLQNLEDFF